MYIRSHGNLPQPSHLRHHAAVISSIWWYQDIITISLLKTGWWGYRSSDLPAENSSSLFCFSLLCFSEIALICG